MNHWIQRSKCNLLLGFIFLTGCQSQTPTQSFMPITGAQGVVVPASVNAARDAVLANVTQAASLPGLPNGTVWLAEAHTVGKGIYRFHSGAWLMQIWPDDEDIKQQHVIIYNSADQSAWVGYVTAEGRVVEILLGR